ncbi:MAG TPA: hypothetical protein VMT95_09830 [Candidatus Binatia bacterium]|nr:hypothetical protein [Candidatus Binatia bacterium]
MDDETFLAFIRNSVAAYDLETLEKAVKTLNDNIASRRWGKPPGLEVGSHVAAVDFDGVFGWYGTVIRMTGQGCIIEPPGAKYTQRISFKRFIMRIVDEFEWNRACLAAEERAREFAETKVREAAELEADRNDAIKNRAQTAQRPKTLLAMNGGVSVYRGALVHAYRPDWDDHEYGVVVGVTPKALDLSSPETTWTRRIIAAKHEIELLDEVQWQLVDAELRRRREEYEAAEESGKTSDLRDYSKVQIPLG